ncbi:MAG: hypothetical protein Q8R15_04970 [Candidatus Micrarchaeota archaeon]|nr:hypothetical protein [Candidatus Micrarchaeota archaeon]
MAAVSRATERRLRLVTSAEATQIELRNFLASEKGKLMVKSHGFRRAFIATPRRVNEALADYEINLHQLGRKGLLKPTGSIEITPGALLVRHYKKMNPELTSLGEAIAIELRLNPRHQVGFPM